MQAFTISAKVWGRLSESEREIVRRLAATDGTRQAVRVARAFTRAGAVHTHKHTGTIDGRPCAYASVTDRWYPLA